MKRSDLLNEAKNYKRRAFWEGETIFREGDLGGTVYLVVSGAVEIFSEIGGKKVVLGEIRENGLFGEMALINNAPRMASAAATSNTVCLLIPGHVFMEKLAAIDPFTKGLLRMLSENVRSVSKRLVKHFPKASAIEENTLAARKPLPPAKTKPRRTERRNTGVAGLIARIKRFVKNM